MLSFCGMGVAMGNGSPELKAMTDDVNRDGLWKAFVHLGLVDKP